MLGAFVRATDRVIPFDIRFYRWIKRPQRRDATTQQILYLSRVYVCNKKINCDSEVGKEGEKHTRHTEAAYILLGGGYRFRVIFQNYIK